MEDQLKDFIHYMVVEKGLAKNTVVSYERDLKSYVKYLQNVEQTKTFHEVTRLHIVNFLQYLKENGNLRKHWRVISHQFVRSTNFYFVNER